MRHCRSPNEWPDAGWEKSVIALYRREAKLVLSQRMKGEYQDGKNIAVEECKDVCSLA